MNLCCCAWRHHLRKWVLARGDLPGRRSDGGILFYSRNQELTSPGCRICIPDYKLTAPLPFARRPLEAPTRPGKRPTWCAEAVAQSLARSPAVVRGWWSAGSGQGRAGCNRSCRSWPTPWRSGPEPRQLAVKASPCFVSLVPSRGSSPPTLPFAAISARSRPLPATGAQPSLGDV